MDPSGWLTFQMAVAAGVQAVLVANQAWQFLPGGNGDLNLNVRVRGGKVEDTIRVVVSIDVPATPKIENGQ